MRPSGTSSGYGYKLSNGLPLVKKPAPIPNALTDVESAADLSIDRVCLVSLPPPALGRLVVDVLPCGYRP